MRRGTSRRTVTAVGIAGLLQSVVVPLASFVSLPLVLSQVGLTAYGWWAGLAGFVAILGLADGGLRLYVNRAVAEQHGRDAGGSDVTVRHALWLVLATGIVLTALVWLLRQPLQAFLAPEATGADATHLQRLLVALTVLLGVSLCNGVLYAYVGGLQRADLATTTVVVATLLAVSVNVGAAYAGAGIDSFLYGSIVGAIVTTTSALWWSRRLFGSGLIWRPARPSRTQSQLLLGTSVVLLLAGAMRVGDTQIAKVVSSHLLGADATATLAVVATLTGIGVAVAMAPSAPLLTSIAEVGLQDRGQRVLRTSADLTAAGAAAVSAGLFALGPSLLTIWLRQDVAGGGATVRWLAPSIVPTVATLVLGAALIALGRERAVATTAGLGLVALAGASVVGARVAELVGIAAALATVYLAVAVTLRVIAGGRLHVVSSRILVHTLVAIPIGIAGAVVVDALPPPGLLLWLLEAGLLGCVLVVAHLVALKPASRREALSGMRALRSTDN